MSIFTVTTTATVTNTYIIEAGTEADAKELWYGEDPVTAEYTEEVIDVVELD